MLDNHALITGNDSHIFPFSVDSYAPNRDIELIHDNGAMHYPSIYKEIIGAPEDCSNVCDDPLNINKQNEPSRAQTSHLMADELNNALNGSLNFSECVSSSFARDVLSSPKGEPAKSTMFGHPRGDNHSKFGSFGIGEDGTNYVSTLSSILGNLKQGISSPGFPFQSWPTGSSFKIWEKGSMTSKLLAKIPQRMLKKILFDGNWMNGCQSVKPHEESMPRNKAFRSEADDANSNHVLSERRRREKLNEKFLTLKSLVPSISKVYVLTLPAIF